MTEAEVESLGTRGWFERDRFPAAAQASSVALHRAASGLFVPAGISRGHQVVQTVRTDRLLWVDADDPQLGELFAAFEALRVELNEGAWLGLTRFDLQLAHYAPGGHYARHRDALQGENNRRVTAIVYLNPDWKPADGGHLRLWVEPPVDVEPRLGQSVVFLSEQVEHEVLRSNSSRLAATAWYYGR